MKCINAYLKFSFLFLLVSLVVFSSCSKDDDDSIPVVKHEPGEIPGLGKDKGELTGEPFKLPDGITLEQQITGFDGYLKSAIDKTKFVSIEE